MTLEQNKAVVKRFIQEVFVKASPEAADELAAPDFTPHSWPGIKPGVDNLKQGQQRVTAGISDARMTIEDMIAEDDKVAVRLMSHGRHTGEFMGLPPTRQGIRHLGDPRVPRRGWQGHRSLAERRHAGPHAAAGRPSRPGPQGLLAR